MALEGTHIRFALDIKEHFQVEDVCKYLSGTIYPDSRYITGIDRNLTHPKDLLERKRTELSDFEKGWLAHLLCDNIQYFLTMEKFPDIAEMEEGQGKDRWLSHTALKILQDIDDIQKFDIKSYLHCLSYIETPNGEDEEKLSEYNAIFPVMYADPSTLGPIECYEMWKKFGIGDELANQVREKLEEREKDTATLTTIPSLYPEMIRRAKEEFE